MTAYKRWSGWQTHCFPLSLKDRIKILFSKNFCVGVDFCEGVSPHVEWKHCLDGAMRITITPDKQEDK